MGDAKACKRLEVVLLVAIYSLHLVLVGSLLGHIRKQTAQRTAQKHNIISRVDWTGEGSLIGIEVCEDMREDSWRFVGGGFEGHFETGRRY